MLLQGLALFKLRLKNYTNVTTLLITYNTLFHLRKEQTRGSLICLVTQYQLHLLPFLVTPQLNVTQLSSPHSLPETAHVKVSNDVNVAKRLPPPHVLPAVLNALDHAHTPACWASPPCVVPHSDVPGGVLLTLPLGPALVSL